MRRELISSTVSLKKRNYKNNPRIKQPPKCERTFISVGLHSIYQGSKSLFSDNLGDDDKIQSLKLDLENNIIIQ